EKMVKAWKKHGKHIIGAAIAIVLATAASVAWQNYQHAQNEKAAQIFLTASEQLGQGETEQAVTQLEDLSQSGPVGYQVLASMRLAGQQIDAGNIPGAIATYQALATSSAPKLY